MHRAGALCPVPHCEGSDFSLKQKDEEDLYAAKPRAQIFLKGSHMKHEWRGQSRLEETGRELQ